MGAIHRLVVRGYDQNAADYDGRTPLHLAAAEGREQLVSYFLENGAEPNPKDRWGGTPTDDALLHGHADVAKLLEAYGGIHRKAPPSATRGQTGRNEHHGSVASRTGGRTDLRCKRG